MATVQECEKALQDLAARLASADPGVKKKTALDRSLTCALRDLDVVFAGRLRDGELLDIHTVDQADGQVKLAMSSDDLLKLVDGELHMGSALATGRIKIDASVFDLIKLRTIF